MWTAASVRSRGAGLRSFSAAGKWGDSIKTRPPEFLAIRIIDFDSSAYSDSHPPGWDGAALAAFERTLVTGNSDFRDSCSQHDRALTTRRYGLDIFTSKGRVCSVTYFHANWSQAIHCYRLRICAILALDSTLMATATWPQRRDFGRRSYGAFRTPSLRNVASHRSLYARRKPAAHLMRLLHFTTLVTAASKPKPAVATAWTHHSRKGRLGRISVQPHRTSSLVLWHSYTKVPWTNWS